MALAQIGFLGWIIAGRAAVLRDGREIMLKIEPVDPHDLLRGDYVSLYYEISRIPVSQITNLPAEDVFEHRRTRSMSALRKGSDGYWHPLSGDASTRRWRPRPARKRPTSRVPSATARILGTGTSVDPDYGIDRFYVPEGEGMAIQDDMRVRPFGVRVALAADGTPQIKALLDGDKLLYEEPLY